MEALSMLTSGKPITSVAYNIGYESPSAFTAMFHRAFGVPPRQYQLLTSARNGPPSMNNGPVREA
jgi:AraC-like DNA-binding protein